jgi:hypothetical protein
VQPDGKRLKLVQALNGADRYLTRLEPEVTLDPSFVARFPAGFVPKVMALQPDGKVLVGGGVPPGLEAGSARTVQRAVVRLNTNGSNDPRFSTNVTVGLWGEDRSVSPLVGLIDLVLQADGKICGGGIVHGGRQRTPNRWIT